MTFSDKIKKLRKQLGDITQAQLAKLLKTTQGTISSWETDISGCREDMLVRLEKLCTKKNLKIKWRK